MLAFSAFHRNHAAIISTANGKYCMVNHLHIRPSMDRKLQQ